MPVKAWRDKDDGYRGLLRNPETGRIFKANAITAKRTDLERITSPDDAPTVKASRKETAPAEVAVEESGPTVNEMIEEAEVALDDLLEEARSSEEKVRLMAIGGQLGVKLTKNMTVDTMKDRIETQVVTIKAAQKAGE
jgi:hypothetical protein